MERTRKRKKSVASDIKKENPSTVVEPEVPNVFGRINTARLLGRYMAPSSNIANPALLLTEYVCFLQLKVIDQDWDATKLSPSPAVDRAWHLHVLDTRNYASDCMAICNNVIHHDPDGGFDPEEQRRRYEHTLTRYAQVFHQEPPIEVWPRSPSTPPKCITINVKFLTSSDFFPISVVTTSTVYELKDAIAKVHRENIESLRLVSKGIQMADNVPLSVYNLCDHSLVHVVKVFAGC